MSDAILDTCILALELAGCTVWTDKSSYGVTFPRGQRHRSLTFERRQFENICLLTYARVGIEQHR